MPFDHIDYTRASSAPGVSVPIPNKLSWAAVFPKEHWLNPIEVVPGSQIRVTNTDGTITVINGAGLTLDPVTHLPVAGEITSLVRMSADQVTTFETIVFQGVGLKSNDLTNLYDYGFYDWITEGSDTYTLNQASDWTYEDIGVSKGKDTVFVSGSSYTLGANIENLTYTGTGSFTGTGNELDNKLTGGTGADKLAGLAGNDTYLVDNVKDVVVELNGQGNDTIVTTLQNYTLVSTIENLIFTDKGSQHTGTGNAAANLLVGSDLADRLIGLGGNDILDGGIDGASVDTLSGGTGDDTYYLRGTAADQIVEFNGQGTKDTVIVEQLASYTLGEGLENLVNKSSAVLFTGTGNANANRMVGNAQGSVFYGLDGEDTLIAGSVITKLGEIANGQTDDLYGGKGNDKYYVWEDTDTVVEAVDEGRLDTVYSRSYSYTLSANVENLTILDGVQDETREAIGNLSANILTGDISDDILDASQKDGLRDTLIGGQGDDVYIITGTDTVKDVIKEKRGQGFDIVVTDGASYRLSSALDAVIFYGTGPHTGFGNSFDNYLEGSTGVDTLNGLYGKDTLYGGADSVVDTLAGGIGDDLYLLKDSVADSIVELKNQGIDTVKITDDTLTGYTLGANVEKLALFVTADFVANGNELDNWIMGGDGADELYGFDGKDRLLDSQFGDGKIDILVGGLGDDTYVVFETGDVLSENVDEGQDWVESYLSDYILSDTGNIENLRIANDKNGNGTGNIYANIIEGDKSDNILDGVLNDILVTGHDTLKGGEGNDTYVVNSLTDVVVEKSKEGIDTVNTALLAYTLASNVENVFLTGTTGQTVTGNLLGNRFDDDGNGVVDTFIGGRGDDVYIVQDIVLDTLVELSNQGKDGVEVDTQAVAAYTLGKHIEDMKVIGGGSFVGSGNELANTFIDENGNGITLAGMRGNDTYVISSNTVTLVENEREGIDEVIVMGLASFTLGANIENLTAGDMDKSLNGTGNELNNVIHGSDEDDTLDGFKGAGSDALYGHDGDDTYIVHAAGDRVVERKNEGVDTVQTDLASYRLGFYVENLVFTGGVAHTGNGNAFDNKLTGDLLADKLFGLSGNDILDGGALDTGIDTLVGGVGDDTYILSSTAADIVVEAKKQGIDTVLAGEDLHSYTLAANVENLVSTSTVAGDFNQFTGNELDNKMKGGAANDTLDGALGNDILFGGDGADTFRFAATTSTKVFKDIVQDFSGVTTGGNDVVNIHGYAGLTSYAQVQAAMTQHFDGVHIQLDAKNSVVLLGIKLGDLGASDFSFL